MPVESTNQNNQERLFVYLFFFNNFVISDKIIDKSYISFR